MKIQKLRYVNIVSFALLIVVTILLAKPSYADHSLGNPCYGCHNLKSAYVIIGSMSISESEARLSATAPNGYVAGGPFDCTFCHFKTDDIKPLFVDGANPPNAESSHPVDVINDEETIENTKKILCMDCHLGKADGLNNDVSPLTYLTKDDSDGYPDHRYLVAGYGKPYDLKAGGTSYPNDATNNSHLTAPYGKESYSGGTDYNRTVLWNGTRNGSNGTPLLNSTTLLCFICHTNNANVSYTTPTGRSITPTSYSIEAEYNNETDTYYPGVNAKGTAGHVILTAGGDLAPGHKLPCYECHDSHASTSGAANNFKLIRNKLSPYGTSIFQVTSVKYDGTNDLIVCAGCHDTGSVATVVGTTVEGLDPVDPYNSTTTGALHRPLMGEPGGAVLANSLVNCLSMNGGCHRNSHDPKAAPDDDGVNCYNCHGPAGTSIRVNDTILLAGQRGGDFGDTTTRIADDNTYTTSSAHNIDFSLSSNGADGSIAGKLRGSCTVCHTISKRADGQSRHGDGNAKNDFRDNVGGIGNMTADEVTYVTNPSLGYEYNQPWLFCIQCHDNETDNADDYLGVIGNNNVPAPGNLDQITDLEAPTGYIYGSGLGGLFYNRTDSWYDELFKAVPSVPAASGTDNNATPVHRYNEQPFRAHYYQTDVSNPPQKTYTSAPVGILDPANPAYVLDDDVTKPRIMDCLDCHYGHGSTEAVLYKPPQIPAGRVPGTISANNGRDICIDCHRISPDAQIRFPDTAVTNRLVLRPPEKDRYNNDIPEHLSSSAQSCAGNQSEHFSTFPCHNAHAPSCETCHGFPPEVITP